MLATVTALWKPKYSGIVLESRCSTSEGSSQSVFTQRSKALVKARPKVSEAGKVQQPENCVKHVDGEVVASWCLQC